MEYCTIGILTGQIRRKTEKYFRSNKGNNEYLGNRSSIDNRD